MNNERIKLAFWENSVIINLIVFTSFNIVSFIERQFCREFHHRILFLITSLDILYFSMSILFMYLSLFSLNPLTFFFNRCTPSSVFRTDSFLILTFLERPSIILQNVIPVEFKVVLSFLFSYF